jgi:hypothetical protein
MVDRLTKNVPPSIPPLLHESSGPAADVRLELIHSATEAEQSLDRAGVTSRCAVSWSDVDTRIADRIAGSGVGPTAPDCSGRPRQSGSFDSPAPGRIPGIEGRAGVAAGAWCRTAGMFGTWPRPIRSPVLLCRSERRRRTAGEWSFTRDPGDARCCYLSTCCQ